MTPDEHTNQEFYLDVGDGHKLYVTDWGKIDVKRPIIFLHGGPGSGISDRHKQRFEPEKQRVIFFDQRGCGKSLPAGQIKHNTTAHLVDDVEKIVKKLSLKNYILTGGSWGSCLALAYAIKHPSDVYAMVLSGIFTARRKEIEHLDNGYFKVHFPDVWQTYLDRTPAKHHDNPSAYHYSQITSGNPEAQKKSAYAYSELEASLVSLDERRGAQDYEEFDPNSMRIELHYLQNQCFLKEGYIMKNASSLTMPVWIVQGRYDMVCPPITAYELHQQLTNSNLIWTIAGHLGSDRDTSDVVRSLLLQMSTQES